MHHVLKTCGEVRRLADRFQKSVRQEGLASAVKHARRYVRGRQHPAPLPPSAPPSLKEMLTKVAQVSLEAFLTSGARLACPAPASPTVSIVIALYNRAELTLACLNSLLADQSVSFEIILVDNGSSDATGLLLDRIDGARIIRNRSNLGYGAAVNQAADVARGDYLLLLNNDTQLIGNSLAKAVEVFNEQADVGAVGAKIILLDGSLQEAGCGIWRDGTAEGYGRRRSPFEPPYMHQRDVDFCSGAFLLTPRRLFLQMRGFDPQFAPAYYEDVDYCVRLRRDGLRVVYQPTAALLHHESASSAPAKAVELMLQKQALFARKHRTWLASQPQSLAESQRAELTPSNRLRVLYLDERVPLCSLGAGYPRGNRVLKTFVELGHRVTLYPLLDPQCDWTAVYAEIPETVEIMLRYGPEWLAPFLRERQGRYDVWFVSRPTCMRILRSVLAAHPELAKDVTIVYDAEAVFCMREIRQQKVLGKPMPADEFRRQLDEEIELANDCVSVVSVNQDEARLFEAKAPGRVHVLGHAAKVHTPSTDFHQRHGLLFVGPIHDPNSPNGDSVRWLHDEVTPYVQDALGAECLTCVGTWCPGALPDDADTSNWRILGQVTDLRPVYESARVFVAPTRFSAGIPLKVIEAASHGVPVVATSLIASQLGWRHRQELLVADTPEEFREACLELHGNPLLWQHLQSTALLAVKKEFSESAFKAALAGILKGALRERVGTRPAMHDARSCAA